MEGFKETCIQNIEVIIHNKKFLEKGLNIVVGCEFEVVILLICFGSNAAELNSTKRLDHKSNN